jgi:hypothetical protein
LAPPGLRLTGAPAAVLVELIGCGEFTAASSLRPLKKR